MALGRLQRSAIAAWTVLAFAASAAHAQVLTSIDVDGDMRDWAAVLADGWQTAHDGPAAGLGDLDAPVPSTGRDLKTFAWTYDADYLYLYVERVASSSNRQRFWFYVDTDEDGFQETGEPVVGVSWWGSNRTTEIERYAYVATSGTGDPLGDPATGLADGWSMPGTASFLGTLESLRGGASNGVEMEARVSWSALGIAPGTPVKFHVATSNSANLPALVHDNMGGPGGSVGSTRIAGIRIDPRVAAADTVAGGSAFVAHAVSNTGASPDVADLAWSAAGDFAPAAVVFWLDVDGDGARGPGDLPLADANGNGRPDVGPIAPGGSVAILVEVAAPATATDGQATAVTVTATSSGVATVSDTAVDTVTIRAPTVTLVKSVSAPTARPGEVLTYSVLYTSAGTVDAREVVVVDPIPADVEYVPGSAAGAGTVIEFSHDDGATFDGSEAAPVTHVRWSLSAPLAPGESGSVSFQARIR